MKKHINIFVVGLAILLGVGNMVNADIIQKDLPYIQESIQVSGTGEVGIYDTFSWNDGINNTISGSVDTSSMTKGNAWLKSGFGDPKISGGWIVFYVDSSGNHKAHLEFSPGSEDSNVVDLPGYSDNSPLYSFTITTNETAGAGYFDAQISGVAGGTPWIRNLIHNKTFDLSGVDNEVFAVGKTYQPDDPKAIINATVSLVPEPCTLLLIGVGIGCLRRRRR